MSLASNPTDGDPDQLSDYMERKVTRRCTRTGCPHQAAETGECESHAEDSRARKRKSAKKRRQALKAKGRCRDCGKKCGDRTRCRICRRRNARRVDKQRPRVDNQHAPRRATAEERTVEKLETDGRRRFRFVGQGKRGRSSKAEESRRDIGEAIKTLERARETLEQLDDPGLSKMQRASKELEVRSLVGLAQRFGDEVVDRHG